ncbi:transposase zinc-binding domain-containing protein [Paraburkholderia mimosarum]|uniref:transposase zinc-binding domain-containing protein n=1 Tax=Paraburkholderia mimosarum TaxID=312026 RepID=UPI00390889A8
MQTGEAWWRYFKKHGHEIRSAVVDNVVRLQACGLEVMGYASHCCSNGACPHRKKVCFSCKSRFCPTCGNRRRTNGSPRKTRGCRKRAGSTSR